MPPIPLHLCERDRWCLGSSATGATRHGPRSIPISVMLQQRRRCVLLLADRPRQTASPRKCAVLGCTAVRDQRTATLSQLPRRRATRRIHAASCDAPDLRGCQSIRWLTPALKQLLRRKSAQARQSVAGLVSRVTPVQTALRNYTGDEGGPFGF